MAIGEINVGYTGFIELDGKKIRCLDFSVNPVQEPLFYDHIIGLRDSTPSSIFGAKGDNAKLNAQRSIWRAGVKTYQGAITFPLTSLIGSPFFEYAKTGDSFDLEFTYTCNVSEPTKRKFSGCKVNTYSFSISAGDIASVTVNIMAESCEDDTDPPPTSSSILTIFGGSVTHYTDVEKIVTWDDVNISSTIIGSKPIQGFTVNINNACKPIYTAGSNFGLSLDPFKLRVGMQMVDGSIALYNKGNALTFMEDITNASTITVSTTDGFNMELTVIFRPQERTGSISSIISSLPFVGVDKALGI